MDLPYAEAYGFLGLFQESCRALPINWLRGTNPLPRVQTVKNKSCWRLPGWPWELELLVLVFAVTAITLPYLLQHMQTPDPSQLSLLAKAEMAKKQQVAAWHTWEGFFWTLVIAGLYLAHLAVASAAIEYLSTPFTHLFSPLLFSSISYYRLCELIRGSPLDGGIVSGSFLELLLWLASVLAITFLLGRIRMARLMLRFRDVDWEISSPSVVDKSFLALLFRVRPLIYFPKVFRACKNGLLIEGWLYAMPIPFDLIEAMEPVRESTFRLPGYCLTTSADSTIQIQLAGRQEPVLISPRHGETLVTYCRQYIGRKRTGSTWLGGTKPGANSVETKPA